MYSQKVAFIVIYNFIDVIARDFNYYNFLSFISRYAALKKKIFKKKQNYE